MPAPIGSVYASVGLDTTRYQQGVRRVGAANKAIARSMFRARQEMRRIQRSIRNVGRAFSRARGSMVAVGVAAAGLGVAFSRIRSVLSDTAQIDILAERFRLSHETIQALSLAAKDLDLDFNAVVKSVGKLEIELGNFNIEYGTLYSQFKQNNFVRFLATEVDDLGERYDLVLARGRELLSLGDSAQAAALFGAAFGARQGLIQLQIAYQGGVPRYTQELRDRVGQVTPEQAREARALDDEILRITETMRVAIQRVVVDNGDALVALAAEFAAILPGLVKAVIDLAPALKFLAVVVEGIAAGVDNLRMAWENFRNIFSNEETGTTAIDVYQGNLNIPNSDTYSNQLQLQAFYAETYGDTLSGVSEETIKAVGSLDTLKDALALIASRGDETLEALPSQTLTPFTEPRTRTVGPVTLTERQYQQWLSRQPGEEERLDQLRERGAGPVSFSPEDAMLDEQARQALEIAAAEREISEEKSKQIMQQIELEGLTTRIGQTVSQNLREAIATGDAWGAVEGILAGVVDALVEAAIQTLIINKLVEGLGGLNLFGGGGEGGGGAEARAFGGRVSSRTPYLVGERGRELFVPDASGTIVPNSALRSTQPSFIVENRGSPKRVEAQGSTFDDKGYIRTVILNDLDDPDSQLNQRLNAGSTIASAF